MKENQKQTKGITLIALVITIIVLLILAGVSIAMLTGENGILTQAQRAKNETEEAGLEEKIKLLAAESIINEYTGENEEKTAEELQKELNDQEENVLVVQWDKYIIFDLDRNEEYRVMSDGSVEYWGKSTMGTTLKNMTNIDTLLIGENSDGERVIGVDYTGKQVNMKFWESTLYEGTYALNDMLSLTSDSDADFTPGYIADEDGNGEIDINEDGSIKGEVPQYIKLENGTSWIAVTNLTQTFRYLSNLTISPVIPETVITLKGTFCDTDIIEAKEIPKGVINMNGTFGRCYNLETAPLLPDTVEDMTSTFFKDSSLKKVEKLPDSVTNMSNTFYYCVSLETIPNLPSNVCNLQNAFLHCENMKNVSLIIPSTVEKMDWVFAHCYNLTGNITIYANILDWKNDEYILASANKSDITTEELEVLCPEEIYIKYYDENRANKLNVDFFGYEESNIKLVKIES